MPTTGGITKMSDRVRIGKAYDIEPQLIDNEKAKRVQKRVLIGRAMGAENFIMRLFTVEEGGHSPFHSHDWEHEVYIVSGEATVVKEDSKEVVTAGSFVFVPSNVLHQFKNTGKGNLEFICVIPNTADEE